MRVQVVKKRLKRKNVQIVFFSALWIINYETCGETF
jgi:hypothetical protein